jgi:autotransporter-associated beta strand protein
MKPKSNPFLSSLLAASSLFALGGSVVSADTVTANATVRVLNGSPDNPGDLGALSLYNDGGGNVQRSFLNFNLSAYNGKSLTTDVTMTLHAGIYGDSLNNVQLGTANSAWSSGTITWNNQPGLTTVPGVTNPSGTFVSGPVSWTIPWYVVEKWATAGYNGIGLTSGNGSTQHFFSLADGNAANHPTLTLTSTDGANGTWSGGDGNWTDSANWASGTVAQGINRTATINGVAAVNVTMDANRSVGALSLSGANHTIAAGAGKLALVTSSGIPSITVGAGTNSTIAAQIVGVDGFEKLGTGTLTLSGANTYSGTTTISAGTLSLAASGALPSGGGVAIAAGGKLSNDAPAETSFALHGLTLTGGELAATSAPNASLGNFNLQGDVTVGGTARSTISADLRIISNQTRDFNVGATGDPGGVDLLISGKLGHQNGAAWGYATKSGAGVMKLTGTNELGSMTVNAGRFILEDNAIGWNYPVGGLVNNSQLEFSVTSGSRSYTGNLGGSGALFKTGSGGMTLTGNNAYSGGTTVDGGSLTASRNTLGSGAVVINNGGTLNVNDQWVFAGANGYGVAERNVASVTLNAGGVINLDATNGFANGITNFFINGGSVTGGANSDNRGALFLYNGNQQITAGGATTSTIDVSVGVTGNNNTITVNTGSTLNMTNTLKNSDWYSNGSTPGGIIKAGNGTLSLSGANTYTGSTTISEGTLKLQGAAFSTTARAYTIASGAVLNLDGNTGLASGTTTLDGAGTLRITGGAFGNEAPNISVGPGRNISMNLGSGASIDIQSGASMTNGGWQAFTWTNNLADLNVNGTFDLWDGNDVFVDSLTGAGTVTGGSNTLTVGVDNGSGTFSGAIGGNIRLTKNGSGTQTLTGAATYTGATTISGGTLALQDSYASSGFAIATGASLELNVSSGTRDLASTTFSGTGTLTKTGAGAVIWGPGDAVFAMGAGSLIDVQEGSFTGGSYGDENWTTNLSGLNVASGATFNGVEANVRVDALTGSGTITSGYTGAGYQNFTFGVNDGSGTFSGALTDSDTASANFVKAGSGTQTLSGTSTYTGTTLVSAGTLLVNGELGNTAVTVSSSAGIGGSGLIAGSLNFGNGAMLTVNLADPLFIAGLVSFDGFGFDDLINFDIETVSEGTYTLLSGSNFDLTNVEYVGLSNAYTRGDGRLAYFQNGSLQVVVIPEPSTALLGALGLLALLRRRR